MVRAYSKLGKVLLFEKLRLSKSNLSLYETEIKYHGCAWLAIQKILHYYNYRKILKINFYPLRKNT